MGTRPGPSVDVEPTIEMIKITLVGEQTDPEQRPDTALPPRAVRASQAPPMVERSRLAAVFPGRKDHTCRRYTRERGQRLRFHLKEQRAPLGGRNDGPGASYVYRLWSLGSECVPEAHDGGDR